MDSLKEIWQSLPNKSDKGDVHSYIDFYEELFRPYRETAKNVLEIGLFGGASMILWEKYFTVAKVYGIDCSETPHDGMADLRPLIAEGSHNIFIMDATDSGQIKKNFEGIKFDIILEDAAHSIEQQLSIYDNFKSYLADGGLYVIEDIQDVDKHHIDFLQMDSSKTIKVIDRRKIKGRYDDVMVVIR